MIQQATPGNNRLFHEKCATLHRERLQHHEGAGFAHKKAGRDYSLPAKGRVRSVMTR
jgi:hypothetical protein